MENEASVPVHTMKGNNGQKLFLSNETYVGGQWEGIAFQWSENWSGPFSTSHLPDHWTNENIGAGMHLYLRMSNAFQPSVKVMSEWIHFHVCLPQYSQPDVLSQWKRVQREMQNCVISNSTPTSKDSSEGVSTVKLREYCLIPHEMLSFLSMLHAYFLTE